MLLAVLPDDGHDAILGDEELLLGENLQGVIEAQTLNLRPVIPAAAQRLVALVD